MFAWGWILKKKKFSCLQEHLLAEIMFLFCPLKYCLRSSSLLCFFYLEMTVEQALWQVKLYWGLIPLFLDCGNANCLQSPSQVCSAGWGAHLPSLQSDCTFHHVPVTVPGWAGRGGRSIVVCRALEWRWDLIWHFHLLGMSSSRTFLAEYRGCGMG